MYILNFIESKLNTTVLEPSSPKCYDIPDNASNLIYPNVNYSDQFCSCPVNKSNEEPYNDCAMCNLDFKPQFNSGKLCYSNLKFNMNETIIHFDSDTEYENKFIVQLIESHRIIISGEFIQLVGKIQRCRNCSGMTAVLLVVQVFLCPFFSTGNKLDSRLFPPYRL